MELVSFTSEPMSKKADRMSGVAYAADQSVTCWLHVMTAVAAAWCSVMQMMKFNAGGM